MFTFFAAFSSAALLTPSNLVSYSLAPPRIDVTNDGVEIMALRWPVFPVQEPPDTVLTVDRAAKDSTLFFMAKLGGVSLKRSFASGSNCVLAVASRSLLPRHGHHSSDQDYARKREVPLGGSAYASGRVIDKSMNPNDTTRLFS